MKMTVTIPGLVNQYDDNGWVNAPDVAAILAAAAVAVSNGLAPDSVHLDVTDPDGNAVASVYFSA